MFQLECKEARNACGSGKLNDLQNWVEQKAKDEDAGRFLGDHMHKNLFVLAAADEWYRDA